LAQRQNRLNGWQRLWLIGAVLAVASWGVLYPFGLLSAVRTYDDQWVIERDYQNPLCAPYVSQPFDRLTEPEWREDQSTCWAIYSARLHEDANKAFPTYGEWVNNDNRKWWAKVAGACVRMSIMVLAWAALVYGLGTVAAWIIRRFRTA
jgi:hypothetical protein